MYKMLPSAKSSLEKAGFSPKEAAWTLIACYMGGVVGIQIVSRFLHHYMPSHTVDCEHSHDADDTDDAKDDDVDIESGRHRHEHDHDHRPKAHGRQNRSYHSLPASHDKNNDVQQARHDDDQVADMPSRQPTREETFLTARTHRPTIQSRITSTFSRLSSRPKDSCDGDGPCKGYSEPCGQECFKIVQARGTGRSQSHPTRPGGRPIASRGASTPLPRQAMESTPLLKDVDTERLRRNLATKPRPSSTYTLPEVEPQAVTDEEGEEGDENEDENQNSSSQTIHDHSHSLHKTNSVAESSATGNKQHHHHVPSNAFMAIGLQTSIAIALHKLPEGFITYATNHANPKLGFSVFLALFIHNITEGFAMALPLYLALNSRWKAMAWSSLLGGLSQPLGAGVAAIWFHLAGTGDKAPGEGVYGAMFAITSGIMASVALQLFSESLDLTHSRGLCMAFAFVGMGILGVSSALTA